VLVYLLCMAAGWRLLSGTGKGLAGLSVLLCALVLLALATQVLYAVVLSLGYGGFSCGGADAAARRPMRVSAPSSNSRKSPAVRGFLLLVTGWRAGRCARWRSGAGR
jgi:hypothetical protein